MRFYYFPKLPLSKAHGSSVSVTDTRLSDGDWIAARLDAWENTYDLNLLHTLKTNGQLDPNIVRYNKQKKQWIVEPGQTRWLGLYLLGEANQRALVMIKEGDPLSELEGYSHMEIKTREDLEYIFHNTKWDDHHGLGYIRRKKWFDNETINK